jgi:hypothetical protein
MKRRKRRGKSGSPSGHGSRFEMWLAARTNPPERGRFSSPPARSRNRIFISGQETTPIER